MTKKRKKRALMPRLGPAQNLRPAGAHEPKTLYNRKRQKAALRRYDEDGFFVRSRPRSPNTHPASDHCGRWSARHGAFRSLDPYE